MLCVGAPPGSAVAAVTASTRSTPESRSNAANSPVCALTATTIIARSGHSWRGNRAATIARRCSAAAGPSMESLSNPKAPIARRRSAAEVAAAPMALIRSDQAAIGTGCGCYRIRPASGTGPGQTRDEPDLPRLPGRTATTENQSNVVNHRFRLTGVPCYRGTPGDTYVNRLTVMARGSTHIDTSFMGLTSSDGVTVDCKLPARNDPALIVEVILVEAGEPGREPFDRRLELRVGVHEVAQPLGEPLDGHGLLAATVDEFLQSPVGEVHRTSRLIMRLAAGKRCDHASNFMIAARTA